MSTDYSEAVPITIVILGAVLSASTGSRMIKPLGCAGAIAAGFVATLLGVGLMLLSIISHSACIDALELCKDRGDGNMSYWFQPFFAIPFFWLVMIASAKDKKSEN